MRLVSDPYKLSTDAGALSLATHAALQDVVHSQLLPNLARRFVSVFIGHRRRSGDYAEFFRIKFSQVSNGLLRKAIAEIFPLRIVAESLKRQHRQHDSAPALRRNSLKRMSAKVAGYHQSSNKSYSQQETGCCRSPREPLPWGNCCS